MKIIEIKDKDIWNNFIKQNGEYSAFLQSWEWGEFQKNLGRKIWRLGFFTESETSSSRLRAAVLIIKNSLPLGKSYLYIPRGPLIIQNSKFKIQNFIEEIIKYINDKDIIFLRFEPICNYPVSSIQYQVSSPVQPEYTLILDLNKSEEELLGEMHPKTRYNIRLAERKGVKIRFGKSNGDWAKFWRLLKETTHRDDFISHGKNYYQKMLELENVSLALAEYEGKVLAANIVMAWGDATTYLHGASSDKYRNLMAPHLLQWETIKKVKSRGFKFYDFWGIAPAGSAKEKEWAGITRFKLGFGGREVRYPGAYDFIVNNFWYKLYCLTRGAMKKFRYFI